MAFLPKDYVSESNEFLSLAFGLVIVAVSAVSMLLVYIYGSRLFDSVFLDGVFLLLGLVVAIFLFRFGIFVLGKLLPDVEQKKSMAVFKA